MHSETLREPVIGGNVYPKYASRNPLARVMVRNFLACLDDLVVATGARAVHEVGCGEGHLLERFARAGLRIRGTDVCASTIAEARRRLAPLGLAYALDVRDLHDLQPSRDAAELVVACEVLEHVPDPERALARLAELARPHLIVSVPREPLWRVLNVVRGHYLAALGNTPGHLQHFSTRRLVRLVGRFARVEEVRTPLPWTMLRCRV